MPGRDEGFWDELIEFIRAGRVIPIVGPELLQIEIDGTTRYLYDEVADRLADRLKVERAGPVASRLDDVVGRFLARGGRSRDVFMKVHAIMNDLQVTPPAALARLARIPGFKLFVSLTFDTLLVQAINTQRFDGAARTVHCAYALNKVDDIPAEVAQFEWPVVYSLLGRHSVSTQEYVISDEDLLEFMCSLQSDGRRPQLLFDELARSNLLLLGCGFPDWLARFFIRTAKSRQLSHSRDEWEYWINSWRGADQPLVVFLSHFSRDTTQIDCDPVRFVEELEREWNQRMGADRSADATPKTSTPPPGAAPAAVFISYAKEDLEAATRIHDALKAGGIEVWLDKERLEGGDIYDRKIRQQIEHCSLFIPVISRNTERRSEGYFRREWRLADDRRQGIADSVPFIVPVLVDELDPYRAETPESFKKLHWLSLPAGRSTDGDVAGVRTMIREHIKRKSS